MDEDFIYERIKLPCGVKLELVTDGCRYHGKLWRELALQIYCESGKDDFRDIGHFASGAPFIYGANERISISHTEGCLAVATIPVNADANLADFSPATALGVDVERADREKVATLRERFLTPDEMKIIPAESVEANVIAWTCKEAMLKAGMDPKINWHHDIVITALPTAETPGAGHIILGGENWHFTLHTMRQSQFVVTVAIAKT